MHQHAPLLLSILWIGCTPQNPPSPRVAAAPSPAAAPVPAAEAHKPVVTATRQPTREPVPIPNSELVRGRSRLLVNAPIAKVRRVVLKLDDYAEFMPHYTVSRILGRKPDGNYQVFMQVAALKGLAKMGAQIEIGKRELRDGVETYESQFVKGNVHDFKAIWRLRSIDEASTELSLEVFLHPKLPLPSSLINGENVSGAMKGVVAMQKRIEAAP